MTFISNFWLKSKIYLKKVPVMTNITLTQIIGYVNVNHVLTCIIYTNIHLQALTNCARAYITYLKSQILKVSVLDYFLRSTFMSTTFQFSEYLKQSLENKRTCMKQQSVWHTFKTTNVCFSFLHVLYSPPYVWNLVIVS